MTGKDHKKQILILGGLKNWLNNQFFFMINEIYRPIEGYYRYEISNIGNIRKLRIGGYYYLAKRNSSNGYTMSTLIDRRGQKVHKIHRLVALAFILNPENKPQVNHINGIKDDNRLENLEWMTASENQKHAYRIGLSIPRCGILKKKLFGNENGRSKTVYQYTLDGKLLNEYESCGMVKRNLGFSDTKIATCCRGEKKTYKGFIWKYTK